MIPDKKTEKARSLDGFSWLVYGKPKVGKSTFLSTFPNALFIPTEDRHKYLSIAKIPAELGKYVSNWEQFKYVVDEIIKSKKEKKFKYKTIIIDPVDHLIGYCDDYICKKLGISSLSKGQYGQAYSEHKKEFQKEIDRLLLVHSEVIFVSSFFDDKKYMFKDGEISRIEPSVGSANRSLGAIIRSKAYVIAYIEDSVKHKEKRIYFKGNKFLEAGDSTGLLPDECKLGYSNMMRCVEEKKGGN